MLSLLYLKTDSLRSPRQEIYEDRDSCIDYRVPDEGIVSIVSLIRDLESRAFSYCLDNIVPSRLRACEDWLYARIKSTYFISSTNHEVMVA
jgi:hypothetical protein